MDVLKIGRGKVAPRIAAVALGMLAIGLTDGQPEYPDRPTPPRAAVQPNPIGINLAELAFYGSECPFVDVFRCSQPLIHQSDEAWELAEPLELRPDGYPARLEAGHWAGALMFRSMGLHYPAGIYVCRYDGQGEIEFDFAATAIDSKPGRIEVEVTPNEDGIHLKIVRTDPEDPIRNIRLLRPGMADSTETFDAAFLDRWRGFRILRFMDWLQTNSAPKRSWADRTRLESQTQAGPGGIAPELLVELANELEADPWICLPHQATDDWIDGFAAVVAEQLAPDRRVYLEYSNETWNGIFEQARHCEEQGIAADLSPNPDTARLRYQAQRSVECFDRFNQHFDRERTIRVLGLHNDNPTAAKIPLEWRDTWKHIDATAVAPYFGNDLGSPSRAARTRSMSVEDVLAFCRRDVRRAMDATAQHARLARSYGLELLAYEGGPHLAGFGGAENDDALVELFTRANRDPAMGEVYAQYLDAWNELTNGAFVAFQSTAVPSKWGAFGLCEDYGPDSESAPKYRAVRQAIERQAKNASPLGR